MEIMSKTTIAIVIPRQGELWKSLEVVHQAKPWDIRPRVYVKFMAVQASAQMESFVSRFVSLPLFISTSYSFWNDRFAGKATFTFG